MDCLSEGNSQIRTVLDRTAQRSEERIVVFWDDQPERVSVRFLKDSSA